MFALYAKLCIMLNVEETAEMIGFNLRDIRRERRMTQQDLARKSNLSARTIAGIESGVSRPSPSILTLIRLSNALQVDLLDLISSNP